MLRVLKHILKCPKLMENMGDRTWSRLASTEQFGRQSHDPTEYRILSLEDLKTVKYKECTQASHCMIFARYGKQPSRVYRRAAILMQMRFDGLIGFPGGLVDPGEDLLQGLNRELFEEMNVDLKKHKVTENNYVVSHYSKSKKLSLHFYALEVSPSDLEEIEENATFAKDFRTEVLGNIRVPLYTLNDGYRGFPSFLTNSFIGNAKAQLLYALEQLKIMSAQEISNMLTAKPQTVTAKS